MRLDSNIQQLLCAKRTWAQLKVETKNTAVSSQLSLSRLNQSVQEVGAGVIPNQMWISFFKNAKTNLQKQKDIQTYCVKSKEQTEKHDKMKQS